MTPRLVRVRRASALAITAVAMIAALFASGTPAGAVVLTQPVFTAVTATKTLSPTGQPQVIVSWNLGGCDADVGDQHLIKYHKVVAGVPEGGWYYTASGTITGSLLANPSDAVRTASTKNDYQMSSWNASGVGGLAVGASVTSTVELPTSYAGAVIELQLSSQSFAGNPACNLLQPTVVRLSLVQPSLPTVQSQSTTAATVRWATSGISGATWDASYTTDLTGATGWTAISVSGLTATTGTINADTDVLVGITRHDPSPAGPTVTVSTSPITAVVKWWNASRAHTAAGAGVSSTSIPGVTGPNKVIYVSKAGSNGAAGTLLAPYATVAYAITQAIAGDVIVVRGNGGTYTDESWGTFTKRLTIMAYPGEQPVFTGSTTLDQTSSPEWTADPGWKQITSYTNNWFREDAAVQLSWTLPGWAALTNQTTAANPEADEPQQLWLAGTELTQIDATQWGPASTYYYNKPMAGRFYYDTTATPKRLYVGFNPTTVGNTAVWSTQQLAFKAAHPSGGPADSAVTTIRGLKFTDYAPFHGNALGALQINQTNVALENVVVTRSAGAGIGATGRSDNLGSIPMSGLVLDRVTASDNGAQGAAIADDGGTEATLGSTENGVIIRKSRFTGNNRSRFDFLDCGGGAQCVLAGVKLSRIDGATITNNAFETNTSTGLWIDLYGQNTTISGNYVASNQLTGIYYEVSGSGTITDNVVADNNLSRLNPTFAGLTGVGAGGIKITGGATAGTTVSNNTLARNRVSQLMFGYDDRSGPVWQVGPPNVTFSKNVFVEHALGVASTDRRVVGRIGTAGASAWVNGAASTDNGYVLADNSTSSAVTRYGLLSTDQKTVGQFLTAIGVTSTSTTDDQRVVVNAAGGGPDTGVFVDAANGNFRLATAYTSWPTLTALPGAVG